MCTTSTRVAIRSELNRLCNVFGHCLLCLSTLYNSPSAHFYWSCATQMNEPLFLLSFSPHPLNQLYHFKNFNFWLSVSNIQYMITRHALVINFDNLVLFKVHLYLNIRGRPCNIIWASPENTADPYLRLPWTHTSHTLGAEHGLEFTISSWSARNRSFSHMTSCYYCFGENMSPDEMLGDM